MYVKCGKCGSMAYVCDCLVVDLKQVECTDEMQNLRSQLSLLQLRLDAAMEGLRAYSQGHWYEQEEFDTDGSRLGCHWIYYGDGPNVATETIAEVEGMK